jgi:hypothetical protein
VGALAIPPVAGFLELAQPMPAGLALVGGATVASVGLSRLFGVTDVKNGTAPHVGSPACAWRAIVEAAGDQHTAGRPLALPAPQE